jgi:carbamoyltransferase
MTHILGISAFYHDSAACILRDGEIVAAAQEERFTRRKHDFEFPVHAIRYCLEEAGIREKDIDYVGFYDKPFLKFERILETYFAYAPHGVRSFVQAMSVWLRQKLHLRREIDRGLGGNYDGPILFSSHHESHAASAFYPSPFERAAILTIDGVGEWSTSTFGVGEGNRIRLMKEIRFPHSLGLLYSAFTFVTGFRVNSGEYKLMGLAPYGEPIYADLIREKLIKIRDDGSFKLNMDYFDYCAGLQMTNDRFHKLFGREPRKPDDPVTEKDMDLAASIQVVTEEVVLKMARHVYEVTGEENLCMAGGCALNCVANGRLIREGPFKNLFFQPAGGDAGGALGAAQLVWHQYLDNPRTPVAPDCQQGSYLGPAYSTEFIREYLDSIGAKYRFFEREEDLLEAVTDTLIDGRVVGWFHGRMEFGPRALGARSILGDPRNTKMQSTLNLKIKFRESFRPFAPSVLEERSAEYFELPTPSPYMLRVAQVAKDKLREPTPEERGRKGLDLLKVKRSEVPAITHVDNSARIQTVDSKRNPRYYRLIRKFDEKTGCPLIVNTSFNIRGEPIVCTPQEAYRCFMFTHMDALVLEDLLLEKDGQPPMPGAEEYKTKFKPD